jgi:HD-like signal output (HDOD) protein
MADTWNYTGHALYRHTDGTTLSQAVKRKHGRSCVENLLLASGTERKKKKFEDSQQEGVRSTQEVGPDHSSAEVR